MGRSAYREGPRPPAEDPATHALLSNREKNSTSSNVTAIRPESRRHQQYMQDAALATSLLPLSNSLLAGVDRLRLSFSLDPAETDGEALVTYRGRGRNTEPVAVDGMPLPVHLTIRGQSGPIGMSDLWATVEFNPSHIARKLAGQVGGLCPWDSAQAFCVLLLEALRGVAPARADPHDVKVVGLHLARDFRVDDPSAWVAAAMGSTPAWSRGQAMYVGRDRKPETMLSGSQSTRVVLYDKCAQAPNAWSEVYGLRWEDQLVGRGTLSRLGLGTVGALTSTSLAFATARLWRQSRLGEVVKTPALPRVVATSNLPPAQARDLLGWLTARDSDLPLDDDLSAAQLAEYVKRASTLGVAVSRRGVTVNAEPRRLDLVSGCETTYHQP